MKKITTLLLVCAIVLSCFFAISCGDDAGDKDTTTAAATTAKATTKAPDIPPKPDDTGDDKPEKTTIEVANAAELAAAYEKIDSWEVALDSTIRLTADIDLSEYSGQNRWYIMEEFDGTLDGNGHKITGLNFEKYTANDGMNQADNERYSTETDDASCLGYVSYGILTRYMKGGTVKDLTIENCALNYNFTFNRNYRTDVAALAGTAENCIFENVRFVNTTVTSTEYINCNQAMIAGMGLIAGRAYGDLTIKNCSADDKCVVDGSHSGRFEVASFVGCQSQAGATVLEGNTSQATVTAMDPTAEWVIENGNKYPAGSNNITEYRASGKPGDIIGLVEEG